MSQFGVEWKPTSVSDQITSSSSKTFTFAEKFYYQIINVQVSYTTNATVGDRLVMIDGLDTDDTLLFRTYAGVAQAASLTYTYNFNPLLPFLTSVSSTTVISSLPLMILKASQKLKVYDANAIAAAAAGENLLTRVSYLYRRISP